MIKKTKSLNLSNLNKSDVKYQVSKFPDGQQDIVLGEEYQDIVDVNESTRIVISSRLSNFKDLELILCATQALRRMGVVDIQLFIPYILGARSDRQFVEGGTSYVVDIISKIINSQNYNSVVAIDPHSDVCAACINNFKPEKNIGLVRFALQTLKIQEPITLISPDAGALKKIYDVSDYFNKRAQSVFEPFVFKNIVIASKHRDIVTSKVTHTEINTDEITCKNVFIVDDICDGGRTFVELAKVITRNVKNCNLYLIVTHGIFSAGFSELQKYFTNVFTTNSVKAGLQESSEGFVKQLNIL